VNPEPALAGQRPLGTRTRRSSRGGSPRRPLWESTDAEWRADRGHIPRGRGPAPAPGRAAPEPQPGDWLSEHRERGQTFRQYLAAGPVRRDAERATIYLCLVGDFDGPRRSVADRTAEYLGQFFDAPVVTRRRVPTAEIPGRAKRTHPDWGNRQLLSTYTRRLSPHVLIALTEWADAGLFRSLDPHAPAMFPGSDAVDRPQAG
jgi:hypothetical protein